MKSLAIAKFKEIDENSKTFLSLCYWVALRTGWKSWDSKRFAVYMHIRWINGNLPFWKDIQEYRKILKKGGKLKMYQLEKAKDEILKNLNNFKHLYLKENGFQGYDLLKSWDRWFK